MAAENMYNVLFISTSNSARSILAEGVLNKLGQGRVRAYSAGSHPKGQVHPLTLATLELMHIPITGYRSKSWDEFTRSGAPVLDFIFTLCDYVAGEACPVWAGVPVTGHWSVADPAAIDGTDEQQRRAFLVSAVMLRRRIELFLSLPLERLDTLTLQVRLHAIGSEELLTGSGD
jgi:arsenate reductase